MRKTAEIVQAFEALAHEARLRVFLMLLEAGPDGLAAGVLADQLGVPPNALSFHLTRLRHASLVESRREGQRRVYTACYKEMEGLMGFLTERCCREAVETCEPVCKSKPRSKAARAASSQV